MKTAGRVPSGRLTGWLALALVAVTVATYTDVWSFGFVNFDDPQYVINNPHVSSGLTRANVIWAFTSGYAANWHPVTWLSHMIDVALFGVAPGPAHAINLALHVANVVLLFIFFARTTGAVVESAVVAALFAVHPLHVESVAWISERKDVLSTFFGLCTVLIYAGYARNPTATRALGVCTAFTLGLMAKPMLVTLPFVLLAVDRWPLGRPFTAALVREKIPLFVLSAVFVTVTVLVQRQAGAIAALDPYPLSTRLLHVISAFLEYLTKTIWPANLAVFYPLPAATAPSRVLAAAIALGLVTWLAMANVRKRPYLLTGWLWYVVMLLPVIGLVQVGGQGMADRYTYLPLVGIFVMVVWGVADVLTAWSQARPALAVAGAVAIVACAIASHRQLQVWRDSLTLWTHALRATTGNYRAENAVGALLVEGGRIDEAIPHLEEAVRLEPAFAEAHSNLGTALAKREQLVEAMAHYREAIRLTPGLAQAHNNLGLALARAGDVDGAIREMREAVRLAPDRQDFRYNLSVLLRQAKIP